MPSATALCAAILAALILIAYGLVLWRMCAWETGATLGALAIVVVAAAWVRFCPGAPIRYAPDDECSIFALALQLYSTPDPRVLLGDTGGPPALLYIVFGAQWFPWIGTAALRGYSSVCGVLACIGTFAVCRALHMRRLPAWIAAAAQALLPWAIFYGRTMQGGEFFWHSSIVLWGLAIALTGRWRPAVAAGAVAFGLWLLLYDYYAGRAMPYMVLASVPWLPRTARRAIVSAVAVAVGLYLCAALTVPYTANGHTLRLAGFVPLPEPPGLLMPPSQRTAPLSVQRLRDTVLALGDRTHSRSFFMSVPLVVEHPWWLLALMAVGFCVGRPRGWLLAVFAASLLPAISGYAVVSTHRMLLTLPLLPLALGWALDAISLTGLRSAACAVVALALVQIGPLRYFTPEYAAAFTQYSSNVADWVPYWRH